MLSTDRISLILAVGAIVVTLGVGMCSTNGRFDDLNRRIDDMNADVTGRIADLNAGVDRRFDELSADIRGLRGDVNRIDERLRAVEVAFGRVDQRLLTIERVVLPPEQPGG